jgi:hypothetical protein
MSAPSQALAETLHPRLESFTRSRMSRSRMPTTPQPKTSSFAGCYL